MKSVIIGTFVEVSCNNISAIEPVQQRKRFSDCFATVSCAIMLTLTCFCYHIKFPLPLFTKYCAWIETVHCNCLRWLLKPKEYSCRVNIWMYVFFKLILNIFFTTAGQIHPRNSSTGSYISPISIAGPNRHTIGAFRETDPKWDDVTFWSTWKRMYT